jgi:hypothetical protein
MMPKLVEMSQARPYRLQKHTTALRSCVAFA